MDKTRLNGVGAASAHDEVEQGLAALRGVQAPASLLPAVLVRTGLADAYTRIETPVGLVTIAYNDHGISAVRLGEGAEDFEQEFDLRYGRKAYYVPELPESLARGVTARLTGGERVDLKFDLRGLSEFEQAVLRKALEIPRGEVRPYAWIAKEIGQPKAVRAVGGALNHNPIPLLIPCHRVVRSDGHLGGYALGMEMKQAVLRTEGVAPDQLEELASRGVRYIGSDTTHIFCYPTCRHARRVTDRHRVTFTSGGAAAAAGYRPCKICRPAVAA